MAGTMREKAKALLAAERGTIVKAAGAAVEVALAYPNTYHLGMSNLGMHQIYALLNRRSDTACERIFLPDDEDRAELLRTNNRLTTLERNRSLQDFSIIAFSVSFEQDYENILTLLDLAGIPLLARERREDDPLLLLGGVCATFNPEPLADFFDVVIVGEGEEIIDDFIDRFRDSRDEGRRELLRTLCALPGVYVPSFYEVRYNEDGTIAERKILEPTAPARITKHTLSDLNAIPAATAILTPHTEFSEMRLAELTRGCGRHCRFCLAGYLYLPPRRLDRETALAQAGQADADCGRIGLVGSALSDYPGIDAVCAAIDGSISVSSLRADSASEVLIRRLAASGHKTVALAPETGSERLRRVINKGVTEADILRAAGMIFASGIPNLKLYFIVGLPTETDEDVQAIAALAEAVHCVQLEHARAAGRIGRITLSVNSFVPKPFTPFQWEPMEEVASLNRKHRALRKAVAGIGNTHLIHDLPKWEYVQALLSRGDRRVGAVIRAVHENHGDWRAAMRNRVPPTDFFVTRQRGADEVFPWDFIDIGVRKDYLRNEYRRAREGAYTPPCNVGSCRACGVCRDNDDDRE